MQYYYGVFSCSELYALLLRINGYPMRWLCHKHKRLRCSRKHKRDVVGSLPSDLPCRCMDPRVLVIKVTRAVCRETFALWEPCG